MKIFVLKTSSYYANSDDVFSGSAPYPEFVEAQKAMEDDFNAEVAESGVSPTEFDTCVLEKGYAKLQYPECEFEWEVEEQEMSAS